MIKVLDFMVWVSLGQPAAAGRIIETGQMSAVETGQMTAAETSVLSQQKTSVLFQQKTTPLLEEQRPALSQQFTLLTPQIRGRAQNDKMARNGSRMVASS